MIDWLDALQAARAAGTDAILVTVVATAGSCPRDPGTRMVVTTTTLQGTIGGGELEYRALAIARDMLAAADPATRLERFPLGARLGQCCGGVAHLLLECVTPDTAWVAHAASLAHRGRPFVRVARLPADVESIAADAAGGPWLVPSTEPEQSSQRHDDSPFDLTIAQRMLTPADDADIQRHGDLLYERVWFDGLRVALFGAGHVGDAIVRSLAAVTASLTWVDNRAERLVMHRSTGLHCRYEDDPIDAVADILPGSLVLVMTQSHALDQALCSGLLERDDLPWIGLIGSTTKRRTFEKRLRAHGLADRALERLVCPIGIDGIDGKHPGEIAIAVIAQMLRVHEALRQKRPTSVAPTRLHDVRSDE